MPGVSAGPPRALKYLSLFSGCGALDYALPWCTPVAYCELEAEAAKVLEARIADGGLPKAPIFQDVRSLTRCELQKLGGPGIEIIVAGFPCVDLCKAGRRLGVQGSESTLVWEVLRIAREADINMIFFKNVDNFRFMTVFWKAVLCELLKLGFVTTWVSLSATHIGSPQRRRRVFMLARRGPGLETPIGPALPRRASGVSADARLPSVCHQKGIAFNFGRPPPSQWMVTHDVYMQNRHRLKMLGNAVIPLQAHLAARILSTGP